MGISCLVIWVTNMHFCIAHCTKPTSNTSSDCLISLRCEYKHFYEYVITFTDSCFCFTCEVLYCTTNIFMQQNVNFFLISKSILLSCLFSSTADAGLLCVPRVPVSFRYQSEVRKSKSQWKVMMSYDLEMFVSFGEI